MSRRLSALFIATTLFSLGGCASSQASTRPEPSTQAQASTSQQPMCGMCPMSVQGAQVEASDVEGGVALTFTTTTGDVGQLRTQVAQMAERHNARHEGMGASPQGGCCQKEGQKEGCAQTGGQDGAGHPGMHGGMGPGMGMPMAAAKASVEEVPNGARLVLKAEDPAQVAALREHMHRHAEMMAKGGCGCSGMQGPHGHGG